MNADLGPAFRAFLLDGIRGLGPDLAALDVGKLEDLCRLVLAENQVQNLTTLVGDFDMAVKHVIDSLTCLRTGLFEGEASVIDIGTGAGFPALPLAVARPLLRFTLLDSLRKRTSFLERAVEALGLDRCRVVTARAEVFGRRPGARESYDLAVTRAVAGLPVDLEYAIPLLRVGGHLVAMKGPRAEDELGPAEGAASRLGASLDRVEHFNLPLSGEPRILIVFRKDDHTPGSYPRREGLPARRPLA